MKRIFEVGAVLATVALSAGCGPKTTDARGPSSMKYEVLEGFINERHLLDITVDGRVTKTVTSAGADAGTLETTLDAAANKSLQAQVSAADAESLDTDYRCDGKQQCVSDAAVVTLTVENAHAVTVDRGRDEKSLPAALATLLDTLDALDGQLRAK